LTGPSEEVRDATGEGERRCSVVGCKVPSWLLRLDDTGEYFCRAHDPSPEVSAMRKTEAARGGDAFARQRRKGSGLSSEELGALNAPEDAQRWSTVVAQAVLDARITPAQAHAANRSVSNWLAARDKATRESQLSEALRTNERLQIEVEALRGEVQRLRVVRRA